MLTNLNELIIRPCQVPSKEYVGGSWLDHKTKSILMSSNFLPTSHHSSKNKITLIHPPQTQPYWWSIKRPRYSILIRLSWLIMRPNRCWSPMDFDHKLVAIAHTTIPPFIQTQDRSSKHKTTVPPPQLWGAYNIFSHGNKWKLGYKVPISSSSTPHPSILFGHLCA